ncbi:MAG: Glucose 1-dehydrogenase 4 [Phycisphaerae bacterium]|nr:Glucose 1-dehydrogenase 4 [Phycisphaerae bacterium]
MNLRFDNKAVLITGASTGIGAAAAVAFAKAGARVGIHYNNSRQSAEDVLAKVVKAGGKGVLIQADLTDPVQPATLVQEFVSFSGQRIDVLVNNAGALVKRCPLEQTDIDLWRRIYALNVESVFLVSKAALPYLRESKGCIVNVGSIAAYSGGGGGSAHYASAKAAVHCLTIGMAKEFAPDIRVNNVAPGVIDTPFHEKFSKGTGLMERTTTLPLARAGKAEDIVGAILLLAHPQASAYTTGETISPNGGMVWRL